MFHADNDCTNRARRHRETRGAMPATYLSYMIEPNMSLEEKQKALYLGVISAGEQAYTLGAALQECRST